MLLQWGKDIAAEVDEYVYKGLIFADEGRDSTVPPDALIGTVAFTAKVQRAARQSLPAEEVVEVATYKRDSSTEGANGSSQWLYAGATACLHLPHVPTTTEILRL